MYVVVYKHVTQLQNVLVIGLVLGKSLMVISTTGVLLYAKVSPIYNVLWECIVVKYKHLNTLMSALWAIKA